MLENGILFEDLNLLLEWNRSANRLALEHSAEIIKQSDRIIIDWGTHTILNGLQLHLKNTYILSNPTQFNFIESQFSGDGESFHHFDIIEKHLKKHYGNPIESEDNIETKREKLRIWQVSKVRIRLYLFEMHAFRLHLRIEKI